MLRRTLLTVVLLAAAVPACSGGDGGSDDALVIYSGRSEQLVAPLLEQFEESSGIDVKVRYAGSADLAAQILEEGGNSPADVFLSQDAGALGALSKADRLADLGALADRVPARFRADDRTWIGVSGRARVIAYNDRKLAKEQVPTSVYALTDAEWRNRVGYAPTNASFQSFVTAMRVLAGEDRTRSWLEGLQANRPQAYENNLQVLDAVNRGEVDVGLINHYYWFERRAEVGADALRAQISFLAPDDPGALVNVAGVAVLRSAAAADLEESPAGRFVDFLLSAEAQTYFRDKTFEYPLTAGVTPPAGLPPLADVSGPAIDLSDLDSLEETLALLDEVGLT